MRKTCLRLGYQRATTPGLDALLFKYSRLATDSGGVDPLGLVIWHALLPSLHLTFPDLS